MLIDLNKAISNDLEPNMIHDHNLSLLIQMNAEAGVHSNIALVSPAVIEHGKTKPICRWAWSSLKTWILILV
jgi:hypothetical protein